MARWVPLLPPLAAVILAAGLLFAAGGPLRLLENLPSLRPLAIVALAGIYVLAGRRGQR